MRNKILDADLKPRHLVHFQKGCASWIETLVRDKKIKFSNPMNFNDPWDCMPHFVSASKYDSMHLRDARDMLRSIRLQSARTKLERRSARNSVITRQNLAKSIPEISEKFTDIIRNERRIYCVSIDEVQPIMWSHYADGHRGACLKFSTDNLFFGSALRVCYSATWPELRLGAPPMQVVEEILLNKSTDWAYEQEYRIISYEKFPHLPTNSYDQAVKYNNVITEGEFTKIPENSLSEIIFGCQMPQSQRERVAALVQKYDDSVKVSQAKIVEGRYELAIENWA